MARHTCDPGDKALDVSLEDKQQVVNCKQAEKMLQDVVEDPLQRQHHAVLPALHKALHDDLAVCSMGWQQAGSICT